MRFATSAPPHLGSGYSTPLLMRSVTLALIPGLAASLLWFGPGVLLQLLLCIVTALGMEALVLLLRRRSLRPLLDWSAILTASLLALSIPPLAPCWIAVTGAAFAILFGKQLYGGLGFNPFNPAMLAYAVLLVSFPRQMTHWAPPLALALQDAGWLDIWQQIIHHSDAMDAYTMATPLDSLKTQLGQGKTLGAIQEDVIYSPLAGKGWQSVNLGFMLGGLWLWRHKLIGWQIPTAFLGSLTLLSMGFFVFAPGEYPTPLFHLLSGGTMLGAFFIATDPVSASTTPLGRLIYRALIGCLVFIIRTFGGYPDAVAFSVLLMNLVAPTLDYYTQPRVYGKPR